MRKEGVLVGWGSSGTFSGRTMYIYCALKVDIWKNILVEGFLSHLKFKGHQFNVFEVKSSITVQMKLMSTIDKCIQNFNNLIMYVGP